MSAAQLRAIGELIEPISTWTPERDDPDRVFTYIDLSAVDQEAKVVTGARKLICSEAPSRARQLVRAGDVLVSTVRPNLNGVALVPRELDGATASTGFCVLRPRAGQLDSRYLYQWVRSPLFVSDMVRKATGASYPAVSDRIVCESKLPLPPVTEQRRIAEILDKADALRAKRRAALKKLDELAQSIFLDMFGDPATNPKGLARIALGDVADVGTGGTPSRDVDGYFGGGIPWVKTTEVQGNVIRRTEETLTDAGLRAIRGKLYPADSIIIAMYGQGKTRGQCALLGIEAAVNQACAVVRPNPEFNSRFMLVQLRLAYERLRSLGRGGNQENLNLELVRSFRLFLPPVEEQRNFVSRLNAIDHVQALANSSLDALHAAFTSLQHRAFRGEL
jgi:type I restriction enzyme S subunit